MNLIGLPNDGLKKVADQLDVYLADLHVLYTKLHNYHWNVEGPEFFALHAKLEEMYDFVAEQIDEVAERILMVGQRPSASLKSYLEKARLQEADSVAIRGNELVEQLLEDYSVIIKGLREGVEVAGEVGDEVSVDLMIGALAEYEKTVWMLRAFLQR
ncbi:MAG: DNA starvation/stationary phase protection protein [Bacillota bacterium]|jgi:starvation-inducible DNA-binding protein|nr:DNA starvation/stationary phase protection protein [Bacillota bacterium]